MSKTIQRTAIILLLLGNFLCRAQQIPAEKKILLTANLQLQKGSPYYNPEEALKSYNLLAEKGNPEAMNALGLIYIKGITLVTNEEKGIRWLEKAAEAGYAQAWFNLGLLYKEGVNTKADPIKAIDCFKKAAAFGYEDAWQKWGTMVMKGDNVSQDYPQAMNIFKEGVEKGNSGCNYSLGYMYYKGLGCTQDYSLAIQQFELGSEKGNPGAMYMLGLCYRNGYGTSIEPVKAKYWLNRSAGRGFKLADMELDNPEAENINPSKLKTVSKPISEVITITESDVPENFKQVKQAQIKTNISGNYTGQLLRYDWSGQNIISKTPLQIDLKQDKKQLSGEWKEEDGDVALFAALIQENAIMFQDSKIDRKDHFHNNSPTTYEFKEAKLQLLQTPESIFLIGNLQLYNIKERENEKPMYLILEKKQVKNATEELEIVSKVVGVSLIAPLSNGSAYREFRVPGHYRYIIDYFGSHTYQIGYADLGLFYSASSHSDGIAFLKIPITDVRALGYILSSTDQQYHREFYQFYKLNPIIGLKILKAYTASANKEDAFINNIALALIAGNADISVTAAAIIIPRIIQYYYYELERLRLENPDWSEFKLKSTAALNLFQTGLDVIGLIPVIGEIPDLVNGGIYLVRGDLLNASISALAIIPIGGQAATGSRLVIKIVDGVAVPIAKELMKLRH